MRIEILILGFKGLTGTANHNNFLEIFSRQFENLKKSANFFKLFFKFQSILEVILFPSSPSVTTDDRKWLQCSNIVS